MHLLTLYYSVCSIYGSSNGDAKQNLSNTYLRVLLGLIVSCRYINNLNVKELAGILKRQKYTSIKSQCMLNTSKISFK